MKAQSTIRYDTAERHLRKYRNRNPIHRFFLRRFFDRVAAELTFLRTGSVLEVGCGEGLFLREVIERGVVFDDYIGLDLREGALKKARSLHPQYRFECADMRHWSAPNRKFDLVIASQVLEHLPEPGHTLGRLAKLCSGQLFLTVPCEPWFRTLNLFRGRDLRRLGNHPEHVNLWTFSGFREFVAGHADVVRAFRVFPFTLVVARPKGFDGSPPL